MAGPGLLWTLKVIIAMTIAPIFFHCVSATNHSVGGVLGWDLSSNVQRWSSTITFRTGDILVFRYVPLHDVLEVNQFDFTRCRTVNPISTHNDGETVIHLSQPGIRHFICGRLRYCLMGLKIQVRILQQLTGIDNNNNNLTAAAPPSGGSGLILPAPRLSAPPSPSPSLPSTPSPASLPLPPPPPPPPTLVAPPPSPIPLPPSPSSGEESALMPLTMLIFLWLVIFAHLSVS